MRPRRPRLIEIEFVVLAILSLIAGGMAISQLLSTLFR